MQILVNSDRLNSRLCHPVYITSAGNAEIALIIIKLTYAATTTHSNYSYSKNSNTKRTLI